MSKYEELHELIVGDKTFDLTASECLGAKIALQWLDQNPDQVPGRTITAGEVGRWSHLINGRYIETPTIIDFLEALGITVVPDPEPTNAELLASLLKDYLVGADDQGDYEDLARVLDEQGVKAGGNND